MKRTNEKKSVACLLRHLANNADSAEDSVVITPAALRRVALAIEDTGTHEATIGFLCCEFVEPMEDWT